MYIWRLIIFFAKISKPGLAFPAFALGSISDTELVRTDLVRDLACMPLADDTGVIRDYAFSIRLFDPCTGTSDPAKH